MIRRKRDGTFWLFWFEVQQSNLDHILLMIGKKVRLFIKGLILEHFKMAFANLAPLRVVFD